MTVMLMRYTEDPDLLCGQMAALCTGFTGDPLKAGKGAMKRGHESVAEHTTFTFLIDEVSKALLAQITRHRMASFSVQSQRYCGVEPEWIVPPKFKELGLEQEYIDDCNRAYDKYCSYIERGAEEEDARYVIPQGVTCRMGMTMNARELRHFFSLRCCERAQWEIRQLADEMLRLCKGVAPMLFADAGPGCVRGKCPEGAKSCGKPRAATDLSQRNARR